MEVRFLVHPTLHPTLAPAHQAAHKPPAIKLTSKICIQAVTKMSIDDDRAAYKHLKGCMKVAQYQKVIRNETMLRSNKVSFTTAGVNVVNITHPRTGTTIKHSLAHDKIFYKGKWYCGVRTSMIINWCDANSDYVIEKAIE
jgi:hypothetical protein